MNVGGLIENFDIQSFLKVKVNPFTQFQVEMPSLYVYLQYIDLDLYIDVYVCMRVRAHKQSHLKDKSLFFNLTNHHSMTQC